MATTAKTTGEDNDDGKDNNNGKDNDSEDNGDNGKDGKNNKNDGGNDDSGGGGGGGGGGDIGGEVGGKVGGVVGGEVGGKVGCSSLPLVAWRLHTAGIVKICLGINLFWSKFYPACLELYTVLILAAWPVSVLIIPYTDTGRSVFRSVF